MSQSLALESRPGQGTLPPEVVDRFALDERLRDHLGRTLTYWDKELLGWEKRRIMRDGLTLYNLTVSSQRIFPADIVLTVHPQFRLGSGQYYPPLNQWTQDTLSLEYGMYVDKIGYVPFKSLIIREAEQNPNSPRRMAFVSDPNGEPNTIQPHQQEIAKMLRLLEDTDNLIPTTRLAATVDIRTKGQPGYNPHVQRLLDNVKWDGLLDRNRRRLINDRAKAVKALSNRPFLRRHILEEMKRRFLAERRGKALITHPVRV